MNHPLAGKAIYLYLLIWGLIIAIHALLLHQLYGFNYLMSVTDGLVFYTPLAGFGLTLYFLVRYFKGTRGFAFNNILTHLVTVVIIALFVSLAWRESMKLVAKSPLEVNYVQENFGWHVVSGALLLVIVLIFYYLMDNQYHMRIRENREKALQSLLRDTEMEMLRFQVNPHFIFNSLNSISALTMENPQQAQEMVLRLSEFFRNALSTNRQKNHTLREELKQIDLYLQIEQVRFGDRLQLVNEVDEKCLDRQVPALILQPLYENAIKYGLYEELEVTQVHTVIKCVESGIKISISNPYDSTIPVRKGRGIGLKNVRSRLELMYHIPDLVTIEKKKNSFTVHLFSPALNNDLRTADR